MRHIDITGQVFGRLTAIGIAANVGGHYRWNCQCLCGGIAVVRVELLRNGRTKSCGCLQTEARLANGAIQKHGGITLPEYRSWHGMINRCSNQHDSVHWRLYGGRGITVCERWRQSFSAFLSDMGYKPTPEHSLDRKDNDGNYEPGNCRWATRTEQACNRPQRTRSASTGRYY